MTSLKDLNLTDKYWDCECETNYIHHYTKESCPVCGARREDQPPSRVNEVLEAGFALTKEENE